MLASLGAGLFKDFRLSFSLLALSVSLLEGFTFSLRSGRRIRFVPKVFRVSQDYPVYVRAAYLYRPVVTLAVIFTNPHFIAVWRSLRYEERRILFAILVLDLPE